MKDTAKDPGKPRPDQPRPDRPEKHRRLRDAAFILPLIGAILVLVPVIWPRASQDDAGVSTSTATIYLFVIWFGMIIFAALLAYLLQRSQWAKR